MIARYSAPSSGASLVGGAIDSTLGHEIGHFLLNNFNNGTGNGEHLGHVSPVTTAVYLTITPELLGEANARFEQWAHAVVTETTS